MFRTALLLGGAGLLLSSRPATLVAQDSLSSSKMTREEFDASLSYTTGRIELQEGLATLDLSSGFRFLDPANSTRLLEEGWGNPPGAGEGVLGMIVPAGLSPLADEGWAVVITYDEDGYVEDEDAASINYAKLLREMQESTESENEERAEQGYEPVRLVGWAESPSYDSLAHKLYWAKELQFGDQPHTLNYNVRVLGRRGVLVLNAVSSMDLLPRIRQEMGAVIGFANFGEGHRYEDYVKGKDNVAAYGIAGLIAGAAASKAGFFKLLLAGLMAGKKVVIVAAVAAAMYVKKLLTGRKESPSPTA